MKTVNSQVAFLKRFNKNFSSDYNFCKAAKELLEEGMVSYAAYKRALDELFTSVQINSFAEAGVYVPRPIVRRSGVKSDAAYRKKINTIHGAGGKKKKKPEPQGDPCSGNSGGNIYGLSPC